MPDTASCPTCSLGHRFFVMFKGHYLLRLASLKPTLGTRIFTRCWNVILLRSRTSILPQLLPAKTVQGARQCRKYRALTDLDGKTAISSLHRPRVGRRRLFGGVVLPAVGSLYGAGTGQHRGAPAGSPQQRGPLCQRSMTLIS